VKRIALWSTPRTVSTALLRSFVNRSDTLGVDEPYYAKYLSRTFKEHPMREEVLAAGDPDLDAVAARAAESGLSVVFEKHMAHHMLDGASDSFLAARQHLFLIRHPREMIPSMVRDLGRVATDDLGFAQQVDLFRRLSGRGLSSGDSLQPPLVVSSQELLQNPEAMLRALCERLHLDFELAMLKWSAGRHECYGIWAPFWYAKVEGSTGFSAYLPKSEPFPEAQRGLLDWATPLYEELHAARLIP